MCSKVHGPITKVIQTELEGFRFTPMTAWLPSADIRYAWLQLWARDVSSANLKFFTAYQVTRMDPADPDEHETPTTVDMEFTVGSAAIVTGTHTAFDGSGYGEGGYLTAWRNVQGTAGSTPGTMEYFWIRFGIYVADDTASTVDWQKGEFTLTVATSGESRS